MSKRAAEEETINEEEGVETEAEEQIEEESSNNKLKRLVENPMKRKFWTNSSKIK